MKKVFAKIWLGLLATAILIGLGYLIKIAPEFVLIMAISAVLVGGHRLTLWALDKVTK
jgi:hypothetical protein